MLYRHIVLGGTFDLFHRGHQDFLQKSFGVARKTTIGVVSDKMALALGKRTYQPYVDRLKNVEQFVSILNLNPQSVSILQLHDLYGTTLDDKTIDAIAITDDSYLGAKKIIDARKRLNLKPINLIHINLTLAADKKPISSTRIKDGSISPEGLVYFQYLRSNTPATITAELRERLSKPQGTLYSNFDDFLHRSIGTKNLISIGDQITYNLMSKKIKPRLAIVDFKVQRQKKFKNLKELGFNENELPLYAKNPPGGLTRDLINKIQTSLSSDAKRNIIIVEGEEDLSVLAAALLCPLGQIILYGLRSEGVVVIEVNLQTKSRFLSFFEDFNKASQSIV